MKKTMITVSATIALLTSVPFVLAGASSAGPSAASHGSRATSHLTPDDCIRLNGGDFNACNVGNSGRGDLPYRIVRWPTPSHCILLNGGDFNACNVGNSGRGDLPYKRPH